MSCSSKPAVKMCWRKNKNKESSIGFFFPSLFNAVFECNGVDGIKGAVLLRATLGSSDLSGVAEPAVFYLLMEHQANRAK